MKLVATVAPLVAVLAAAAEEDSCQKYSVWGEDALAGCRGCQKYFPADVDKCMGCGKACFERVCAGKSQQECVQDPAFLACDKKCLARPEPDHHFSPNATCDKFSQRGPDFVRACRGCAKEFPTPRGFRHCLGCGGKCHAQHCEGKDMTLAECLESADFKTCDRTCLQGSQVHSPCDKYASWGPDAAQGCKSCEKAFPTEDGVDKCMECGKKCWEETCEGKSNEECVQSEAFIDCDKKCIQGVDDEVTKEPQTSEDCYFDTECHKLVDWHKIGMIKKGFFMRLKMMKRLGAKRGNGNVLRMMRKVGQLFVKAGMPEDRADYITKKWVMSVYPESLAVSEDEEEHDTETVMV